MNWIKEHKFLTVLAAVTLGVAVVLVWLGLKSGDRYAAALQSYGQALGDAERFEKLKPYPSRENLTAKKVALENYRKSVAQLQEAYHAKYNPGEINNVSVQAFADQLKQAREETLKAFGEKTEVPDDYFMGFEAYRSLVANGSATGILVYQMDVLKHLMLEMADSGVTGLINLHRPLLEEEEGRVFEPAKGQIARELPLELTFRGPEAAARKFLSSIVNNEKHCLLLRSLSIRNVKTTPPNAGDAQFERSTIRRKEANAPTAAAPGGADLSKLFEDAPAAQAGAAPEAAPPPAAKRADTSRILSQVLGSEEVTVFMRLDILQLLPPKELP